MLTNNLNSKHKMGRFICFMLFSLVFIITCHAQKSNKDFGKVTKDEIDMKIYSQDSTAKAVILLNKVTTYYKYENNTFIVYTDYYTRIKILKQEGTEHANVTLLFYAGKNSSSAGDRISQIKANAYNSENGKIIKSEMDKKYIFEERVSPLWKQIKFSIPNAKAGTVIEYQYRQTSDFAHVIPDMHLQFDIPVKYGYYEVRIPEFFNFNASYKKNFQIDIEEKVIRESLNINNKHDGSSTGISFQSRKMTFITNDMPALKEEPYSWCKDDYRALIGFELHGIQMPGEEYKPYTSTWEKIDEDLKKDEDFGVLLALPNPYQEELKALNISQMGSKTERIETAFRLLKSKMAWDGKYALYTNEINKAIRKGTGSNAEMNFVLLSILGDLGVNAYPMLLSRRELGRLPMIFPTKSKLNTFIVCAETEDNSRIYLDGSMETADLNILPPTFMVENARALNVYGKSTWSNLTKIGKDMLFLHIKGTIDSNAVLHGEQTAKLQGQYASNYRRFIKEIGGSDKLKVKNEESNEITITDSKIDGVESPLKEITETISFEKKLSASNEYVYLNPMVFPLLQKNPFIQKERLLPVEMNYPYSIRLATVIEIPESYQIEELPKSGKFIFGKDDISCTYTIQSQGNTINLSYIFTLKQIFFQKDVYTELRDFWATLINKNSEIVVLKKK